MNKIRQKIGVQEFILCVEIINNLLHIKIVRKVDSYHMFKERNYNYLSFMNEENLVYMSHLAKISNVISSGKS